MKKDKKSNILEIDFAKEEKFDEDILKQVVATLKELNPRSFRMGLMLDEDTILALDFCKSYGDKLAITQFLQSSTTVSIMEDVMLGHTENILSDNYDDNDDEE